MAVIHLFLPNSCVVPQDSILDPLLFILYINDIVNTYNLTKVFHFADDINLFFRHKDLETLINIINAEQKKNFILVQNKRTFFEY